MRITLVEKRVEAENTFSFIFKPEQPITWLAGQFLTYKISDPSPDDRSDKRFFTIASAPFEGHIQLTTKFVPGDGSTFKKDLQALQIGDVIETVGNPSGEFIVEDPNKSYVFIAGGIGITPFRSILLQLDHENLPINVTLLHANKFPEAIFKNELEALAQKHPNLKIRYAIDPQRIDEKFIEDKVPNFADPISGPIFYVSGPEPMVEAMETMLYSMGVDHEKVIRDYFPGYESY